LEKCLKIRLYNLLEKSNVFSKNQFGFRQNKGKSIALQTLVSCIHNNLDEGNLTLGIFLDVTKAFDSVDHKILLNKLDKYDIRGIIVSCKSHAKEILTNLYFYKFKSVSFNHNYSTRQNR